MRVESTQLFKVKDVARLFAVSPATVYRLVESGRLSALRFGTGKGAVRVTGASINAYVAQAGLTSAQACGVACVVCNADFVPVDAPASVPVGAGHRTQLFACVGVCAEQALADRVSLATADVVSGATGVVGEVA